MSLWLIETKKKNLRYWFKTNYKNFII